MLMNYHELTMDEPRHSKARNQQFAVICSVMATAFVYSCLTAGVFGDVVGKVQPGIFPGGYYMYKFGQRDYVSSPSLARVILQDLGIHRESSEEEKNWMYTVYLDNPRLMGGRRQRFGTGILGGEEIKTNQMGILHSKNEKELLHLKPLTPEEEEEMSIIDLWKRLPYETTDLPSVDSIVLEYPYSGGFVSALLFSYRIIPILRQMQVEKGGEGAVQVVISNCSTKHSTCTLYAPLVQGKDFLLGREDTTTHLSKLPEEHFVDLEGLKKGAKKVLPFLKSYL